MARNLEDRIRRLEEARPVIGRRWHWIIREENESEAAAINRAEIERGERFAAGRDSFFFWRIVTPKDNACSL